MEVFFFLKTERDTCRMND